MKSKLIAILLGLAICCGCSQNPKDIFQAVDENNASFVEKWIKKGGNPNGLDFSNNAKNGDSLPYIATGPHGGNKVLKTLLEGGANPNLGSGKYTPLMNAASWANLKAVNILLSHGADPNLRNERGQKALEVVGRAGGAEQPVIEVLKKVTSQK